MKKWLTILLILAVSATGSAVTTRIIRLNSLDDFLSGETEGVEIGVTGYLRPGPAFETHDLKVEAVWSLLEHSNGRMFVGTGSSGKVFMKSGKSFKEILDTDTMAITSLVQGSDGKVYASAVPGGQIFRINSDGGGGIPWATLPDKYVWSLAAGKDGTIYAGTGPEGGIWAIDRKGNPSQLIKFDEDQAVTLAADGKGRILAGTEKGTLYIVEGKSTRVLTSFPKMEISAIVLDQSGEIIIGVNSVSIRARSQKAMKKESQGNDSGDGNKKKGRPPSESGSGSGEQRGRMEVYRYSEDGRLQQIFGGGGMFVNDLAILSEDSILIATGPRGRIIRLDEQYIPSLWTDLEQSAVTALAAKDGKLRMIGTANPGVVLEVSGRSAGNSSFTSKALNVGFTSTWGVMSWKSDGRVKVETRTGNVEIPDENSWSEWQSVANGSKITSPPGRYIQFRIKWGSSSASISDIKIAYRPVNQPPLITSVRVKASGVGKKASGKKGDENQKGKPGMASIEWKTTNPDGDKLVYRLHYQRDGDSMWVPINSGPITKTRYKWSTSDVPDGWYRVRVTASDEEDNPPGNELTAIKITTTFLVDNSRPEITGLKVDRNNVATGTAVDGFSRIAEIYYSIDGEDWKMAMPSDGLLDQQKEPFRVELGKLDRGEHNLSVVAVDDGGNSGTAGVTFNVR